jgi:ATP-binding cassette subfamily B protein
MKFPFYKQLDAMDCGPTCLKMVAEFYGKNYSLQNLRAKSFITRSGVSMLGISDAAEAIGFRTMGVKASLEKLAEENPVPFIAHWKQSHFVVVYKIKKVRLTHSVAQSDTVSKYKVYVSDPAHGLITYTGDEFKKHWATTKQDGEDVGVVLLLEPTPAFYESKGDEHKRSSFTFLLQYLRPHKKFLVQLALGMLLGSLLQLIFPFLTQSIVDVGINTQNLNFVYLVLIAQLVLFIARMATDFIRGWILLHISTRINISLISDFLIKLMKLPVGFFDTKLIGDLMQRIGDHRRIENFLTSETLNILFSFFNLVVFGAVLAFYSWSIFFIFLTGSVLYILWILLFMKKRRELDYKRFQQSADNQSNLFQLITGMQEIKLNNCEKQKRWEWERIQARLFKVSVKGLALSQYQQAGSVFFNEGKNILITVVAATSVIKGDMTLGMMMAVQYITGQLNSPISQMITFMQSMQDAKISMERLGEIHEKPDEEDLEHPKLSDLPEQKDINIENLDFQYEGPHSPKVLDAINLTIPQNKITAIVGASGSGKTTLIKLLLGFYPPVEGKIYVGKTGLENFSQRMWREKCGVVMQDGYIFSDTIANNIAVSDESVDRQKLLEAVKVANIQSFVEELPLAYNTKIGQEGSGISQGQKQRMLIARAVYKNPEYIFLDEATNALDANNEKVIMENLNEFFKGRTVVVVAHRLSTVKNADQIVVLDKGKIVETGTHKELAALKGKYYELVKNQLELGN